MRLGTRHDAETRALMSRAHKTDAREQRRMRVANPNQGGAAHPRWKGGVTPRVYRAIAFAAHGAICAICRTGGTGDNPLEVRHHDGDRANNDPANLVVLCRRCNPKRRKGQNNGR
jgi:hypothetical protein